jgi:hypothetical protein
MASAEEDHAIALPIEDASALGCHRQRNSALRLSEALLMLHESAAAELGPARQLFLAPL